MNFDKHFRMHEEDAIAYAREKLSFFPEGADLSCNEIGDGNINYVFRVADKQTGKSVIIKHADVQIRTSKNEISTDRNRIESEVLQIQGKLAPGFVPEVYSYDPVMKCLVMEDLKSYENLRYELIEHKTFSTFADDITSFMAKTLIETTDAVMHPKEKKEYVKRYINPDMCDISERLVFTEPYFENPKNNVTSGNEEFVKQELINDSALKLEVAELKELFKNKAQSLVHGDLHTGSIFVTEGSTKVLDPEFAFYGPAGYDLGNVTANLIFAWANAFVTIEDEKEKAAYLAWLEDSIQKVTDQFKTKARAVLSEKATEKFISMDEFANWYVEDILTDAAGIAGLELIRRIAGGAKVADIKNIEDTEKKILAERICILSAKEFITNRKSAFKQGSEYTAVLNKYAGKL